MALHMGNWGYNSYNAYKLSGVMAPFVSFAKK